MASFVALALFLAAATTQLPSHGGAFVTTLPLGADIWVDGAYVGRTPAFVDLLSVGKHTIVVTRTGWEAQSATIDVAVGQVVQVSLTLAHAGTSASHDLGELDVRGSPAGGTVLVDGKKIGAIPATAKLPSGYHIVTVIGKPDERSTRDVNVYPDTITTVSITAGEAGGSATDILEPVSSYIPDPAVTVSGSQITIKYHNNDLRCAVGSRAYTLNGKEGLLSIAPAMLSGKLYLPQSLLQHLSGR
ncbi:MAG: PEGA domain-containing protein [Candidatus Eremiobacteraeota bacterium]|nr:PEGA domain-containing protein [Candidatus Eremiobacteraeota bacterium]MBV8222287.1 PEGA domain-containing protein [Candidatus Eremiobacteraeota bacterium]MBV8282636.1 PEGA domain-containing protein [Candidatus Eremiobacteraeota bacterium]